MKEFIKGVLVFIGASIVTITTFWFLFIYSFIYSIWLTITLKKWYAFFQFWWRTIDGTFSCLGHLLYQLAYALDLMWNVYGEAIEDVVTTQEHTSFGKKNITVSAAIGELEVKYKLTKSGLIISSILNVAFNQNYHAIDSWIFLQERLELQSKYFSKRRVSKRKSK